MCNWECIAISPSNIPSSYNSCFQNIYIYIWKSVFQFLNSIHDSNSQQIETHVKDKSCLVAIAILKSIVIGLNIMRDENKILICPKNIYQETWLDLPSVLKNVPKHLLFLFNQREAQIPLNVKKLLAIFVASI